MPTDAEMFAHLHRDGLRELELERAQVHQHTEGDLPLPSMVIRYARNIARHSTRLSAS